VAVDAAQSGRSCLGSRRSKPAFLRTGNGLHCPWRVRRCVFALSRPSTTFLAKIGQSVSVAPEVLEARGRQFGVAHGVLDVSMAEIRLQGARVGALVGKLKAAGVTEHVWVGLEAKLGRDAQPPWNLNDCSAQWRSGI
jgi:hypothetical protein